MLPSTGFAEDRARADQYYCGSQTVVNGQLTAHSDGLLARYLRKLAFHLKEHDQC
jgi:hypothetical protein